MNKMTHYRKCRIVKDGFQDQVVVWMPEQHAVFNKLLKIKNDEWTVTFVGEISRTKSQISEQSQLRLNFPVQTDV